MCSLGQVTDEDLKEVIERLKGNEACMPVASEAIEVQDVTELDLSHNAIKDSGVQALVAALAAGAAPKLQELKIYRPHLLEMMTSYDDIINIT